jgi:hypothetical protein
MQTNALKSLAEGPGFESGFTESEGQGGEEIQIVTRRNEIANVLRKTGGVFFEQEGI